jgi:hypothetical protein
MGTVVTFFIFLIVNSYLHYIETTMILISIFMSVTNTKRESIWGRNVTLFEYVIRSICNSGVMLYESFK